MKIPLNINISKQNVIMMAEKGGLLYEYSNFKTQWIWVTLLGIFIILQIGWIVIFSIMIVGSIISILDISFWILVLILELCTFSILFLAYEESNSFGTKFQIYDNGFVSPKRTFMQYLKNETNYIPFNQIRKIKIETYKQVPKYDYIKFESFNDGIDFRFLFSMLGENDGLKKIGLILKENIPEIWKNREVISN